MVFGEAFTCNLAAKKYVSDQVGEMSISGNLRGWKVIQRAPKKAIMELTIHLQTNSALQIKNIVNDRSDPHSRNYAKWLTRSEINSLITPENHVVNCVKFWIEGSVNNNHNISIVSWVDNNSTITVRGSIANLESWLETSLYVFERSSEDISKDHIQVTRKIGVHTLPLVLFEYVAYISNLFHIPVMPTKHLAKRALSSSDKGTQPIQSNLKNSAYKCSSCMSAVALTLLPVGSRSVSFNITILSFSYSSIKDITGLNFFIGYAFFL